MNFIWDGVRGAFWIIANGDSDVVGVVKVTLRLALLSTLLALAIGLPLGLWLGLARFRGRRAMLAGVNAGLGFPPVVVGLVVALLLFRGAPLGSLNLIYTVNGMVLAQTVLSLPIVAALTAAAVQAVDPNLLMQAQALGASPARVGMLALREARIGVLAATVAALGSALSEVGALVLVGGNITGQTQTLATSVLTEVSAGEYSRAIALGTILMGLVLVLSAMLTVVQHRGQREASA
jgi:tungstate transport system permease protein